MVVSRRKNQVVKWRFWVLVAILGVCAVALVGRSFHLHVFNQAFLKSEADKRQVRSEVIPAPRGMILDRRENPLAVSIPVKSVAMDARFIEDEPRTWAALAEYTGVSGYELRQN